MFAENVELGRRGFAPFGFLPWKNKLNTENDKIEDDGDVAVENAEANGDEKQPMKLDVAVETTSACVRHVSVTVPRDEIERYFAKQFDDLMPKAEVPGFRIGKAPRKLVENKFRKQLADQVKGSILMDSLSQISDEQDFSAISEPDLDFETVKLPEEGPMKYEFDIEVRPDFDMPNWKGLSLERPEHEFSDEEIDRRLNQFVSQMSELSVVDEPAQANDSVSIRLTSTLDGEQVSVSDSLTVSVLPKLSLSDCEIENFADLVGGKKAGDKVSTKAKISEFSDNEDLADKEVDLEIEILEVSRSEESKVADIASKIGVESESELRDLIENSLTQKLEYAQRQGVRDQICALLTESATWDLPQDLLRRQSKRELERAVMEMRRSGFSEPEIQEQENSLRRNAIQRTETLLKEHFILERIAEAEEIEDSPQDYDLEIAKIAAQRGDSPRRVRAQMERRGQMDSLRNMIIEQKVIDLITENAKFKASKYTPEDAGDTASAHFFVGGQEDAIPEAKYEPGEEAPIPGTAPAASSSSSSSEND